MLLFACSSCLVPVAASDGRARTRAAGLLCNKSLPDSSVNSSDLDKTRDCVCVCKNLRKTWHAPGCSPVKVFITSARNVQSKSIRLARKSEKLRGVVIEICRVEMWRGGLGAAYLLPALSSAGASLASPCFRFHIPLIEPDVRISRFRLSEKTHAIAEAIACDAVCNF